MSQLLNEKFFFDKTKDLEFVVYLDGERLYTSNYLKELYATAILDSKYGKIIYNEIKNLMDEDIIIPVWVESSFLKRSLIKIFGSSKPINSVGAFYSKDNGKVYILIDNNVNIFSWGTDNMFTSLTIHEGIHLVSDKKPSQFLSIFQKDFIDFYKHFFCDYFSLDKKNKYDILSIVKYTYSLERSALTKFNPEKYIKLLSSIFLKNIDNKSEEYKSIIFKIKKLAFMIQKSKVNPMFVAKYPNYFSDIRLSLKNTYMQIFRTQPEGTLFYQECFYPSEIISILSEINITPKIIRAFKLL